MTDLELLKKELDKVDAFISSLGKEGKNFIERLHAANVQLGVPDDRVPHRAYYDTLTNTFYCKSSLPFPVLFNLRVHEGVHALQFNAASDVRIAMNNLAECKFDDPLISPEDLAKTKELAEIAAHTVQAHFNAMAAAKQNDPSFITCLEDDESLGSFVKLQTELFNKKCTLEDVTTEVAKEFSSLDMPSPFSPSEKISQKDMLDLLALVSYLQIAEQNSGQIQRSNFISISDDTLNTILNTALPIPCSETILMEYRNPLKLSSYNKRVQEEIGPHIK